jgi:DNA polymerase elongation subunit (family B)
MQGWLFDVYPDYERDLMVTWLLTKQGRPVRRESRFTPCIYVWAAGEHDLGDLQRFLKRFDSSIHHMEMVTRLKDIRDAEPVPVLEIGFDNYRSVTEIARLIDARGDYKRFQLYNVDQSLPFRYLALQGLFPNALVNMTGSGFELRDEIGALDYPLPPLKMLKLRRPGLRTYNYDEPLKALEVDEELVEGSDREILEHLKDALQRRDPDIILSNGGDHFLIPYLQHSAGKAGIPLTFDRDKIVRTPFKRKDKSYFTYGRIVYKPAPIYFKGRAHIDRSSFMFAESGVYGVLDLSRLSGLTLQRMSRLSPGTAISSMQIRQAMEDGCLVMWKKNIPETFKTARELMTSDRGGFIFEPVVGLHEEVVEVDFTSLYPFIISNYNISPETLMCPCCPGSDMVVPALGYHICQKKRGLIPRVLLPIIERRIRFKRWQKNGGPYAKAYKERSDILKWILVTCFGYTGYRNARFGRIECHESITAYGRDILLEAKNIAQDHGFRILHGIVDSLWLKGPTENAREAAKHIGEEIGIPLELEGIYKWIVFLPNKGNGTGALNRYYGVFQGGESKVRGIELRRRDTTKFIADFQRAVMDVLAKADDKAGFTELIPECLEKTREEARRLRAREVKPEDLVITKIVSKELEEYTTTNDQACCLYLLKKKGINVNPGQKVRFVVTDAASKEPQRRLVPDLYVTPETRYDPGAYMKLLARSLESILSPFGWTEKRILAEIS